MLLLPLGYFRNRHVLWMAFPVFGGDVWLRLLTLGSVPLSKRTVAATIGSSNRRARIRKREQGRGGGGGCRKTKEGQEKDSGALIGRLPPC